MDKKQLFNVVDSILLPLGYKRKNSRWQLVGAVVTKGVDLQRSRFGNRYYINFGVDINDIQDARDYHLFFQLGSGDKEIQKEIMDLLLLDNNMEDNYRRDKLTFYIREIMLKKLSELNTHEDIVADISSRSFLSIIPPVVLDFYEIKKR
jgi:hypothetical protein